MVAINNPFDELQRKLDKAREDYQRLRELVKQGFISERLGEYSGYLLILNQLAYESEVYARFGDINRAGKSLADMKGYLDGVAGVLLARGKVQLTKIGGGLSIIQNPDFDNLEKYRELYDLAKQRCDNAVSKCEQILEAAA